MNSTTARFEIGAQVQLIGPDREWAYTGVIVSQEDDAYCGSHDGGRELTPGVALCPGPFYGVRWDFGVDGEDAAIYSYGEHELESPVADPRVVIATETAEHIAATLASRTGEGRFTDQLIVGRSVSITTDLPMPTTVEDIRDALLAGELRATWMDDYVVAQMRRLHA